MKKKIFSESYWKIFTVETPLTRDHVKANTVELFCDKIIFKLYGCLSRIFEAKDVEFIGIEQKTRIKPVYYRAFSFL